MILLKRLLFLIGAPLRMFPKKKIVLFRSFHGQYNDNPKAISERLYEKDKTIVQVWAISNNANKDDIPNYLRIVKYNSLKYYYYIYRSKIVVDNYAGIVYGFSKTRSGLFKYLAKDKKQLNISTWHGTPLKRIGKYQKGYSDKTFISSSDIVTANSKYMKDSLEDSFGIDNIFLVGSPRNDILFKDNKKMQLKKKLGLANDKRIVLFAPTFRNSLFESGEHQLEDLDIEYLLKTLSERFGGKWVFVARMHNEILNKTDASNYNNCIVNGNRHDDMSEYLYVSDLLITDYSSSMFDYIYSGKPCFLYMLDKESYETDDRGFYIKLEDTPFSFAQSRDELINNIKNFDEEKYARKCNNFLDRIGSVEDGLSSERVASMIIDYYNNNFDKACFLKMVNTKYGEGRRDDKKDKK